MYHVLISFFFFLSPYVGLHCGGFAKKGNSCALRSAKRFWRKMSDLFVHVFVSTFFWCSNPIHEHRPCRIFRARRKCKI
jgi:hypothetical protein